MKHTEIESQEALHKLLNENSEIKYTAFQNLDFFEEEEIANQKTYSNCIFLGCKIPGSMQSGKLDSSLVFPLIDAPFNTFINKLYTRETLMGGYELGKPESYENTLDQVVYRHYIKNGKEADDIKETLARRLHDHSITDALYDFLERYDEKKVVAIMGGHGLPRTDRNYLEIALISKKLTELGYLMTSGGGPGAMEATHLGAWFADKSIDNLKKAITILSEAPVYSDKMWLDKAFQVLSLFPDSEYESLGIPTWLYGHEPPSPFATKIAKYFANSVREDGLLTVAKGGIVFAPGSAGTIQEIFQEAVQNHYLSFGFSSPMIFFNSKYWNKEMPVYPLLKSFSDTGKYKNMILSIYDNSEAVVKEILKFTEVK